MREPGGRRLTPADGADWILIIGSSSRVAGSGANRNMIFASASSIHPDVAPSDAAGSGASVLARLRARGAVLETESPGRRCGRGCLSRWRRGDGGERADLLWLDPPQVTKHSTDACWFYRRRPRGKKKSFWHSFTCRALGKINQCVNVDSSVALNQRVDKGGPTGAPRTSHHSEAILGTKGGFYHAVGHRFCA